MFYKAAFWLLVLLTAASSLLQLMGYDFLDILIALLILDTVAFGAMVEMDRRKTRREIEINNSIYQKIDKLESICRDVLQRVTSNTAVLELEEKLNKHIGEEKDSMDRIAEKTLQLEKKLNRFGTSLAEHMGLGQKEDVSDYVYIDEEE